MCYKSRKCIVVSILLFLLHNLLFGIRNASNFEVAFIELVLIVALHFKVADIEVSLAR